MSSTRTGLSSRTALGLAAILLFFFIRFLWVLHVSFINDDFLFLERARTSTFLHNLSLTDDAMGNAYRPLPRNFYFWFARRAFGIHPFGYHVVSLLVALGALVLFFFVLRRLFARDGPALLGTLLFAAHPVAETPVAWVCGMQDLMCVGFSCGAFLAFLSGRRVLYPLLAIASVLSKDTSVALPAAIWTYDVLVRRTHWKKATRAQAPVLAVLVVWAAINPWLPWAHRGSQVYSNVPGQRSLFGHHDPGPAWLALTSLFLAVPHEFVWPYHWLETLGQIVFAAAALVLALLAPWPTGKSGSRSAALALVGLVWMVTGILPLFAVVSHFIYYGFYPALGATLAVTALIALFLDRAVWAARFASLALVAALVAGAGQRHTPALIDGQAVRRSSAYLTDFQTDLKRMHPTLDPRAHVYFWNIPVNIGFQLADGIALRVWYADSTLRGAWMNEYVPAPGHRDYFFGHDGKGHLFEIVRGDPDPYLTDPPLTYTDCHNDFGVRLANLGEMAAADTEWRKVLFVDPRHARALQNLGLVLLSEGNAAQGISLLQRSAASDPTRADTWYFLALSQLDQAQYDEAAQSAERFLKLYPDSKRAAEMRDLLAQAAQHRKTPTQPTRP